MIFHLNEFFPMSFIPQCTACSEEANFVLDEIVPNRKMSIQNWRSRDHKIRALILKIHFDCCVIFGWITLYTLHIDNIIYNCLEAVVVVHVCCHRHIFYVFVYSLGIFFHSNFFLLVLQEQRKWNGNENENRTQLLSSACATHIDNDNEVKKRREKKRTSFRFHWPILTILPS